MNNYTNTLL